MLKDIMETIYGNESRDLSSLGIVMIRQRIRFVIERSSVRLRWAAPH